PDAVDAVASVDVAGVDGNPVLDQIGLEVQLLGDLITADLEFYGFDAAIANLVDLGDGFVSQFDEFYNLAVAGARDAIVTVGAFVVTSIELVSEPFTIFAMDVTSEICGLFPCGLF
ncbi:hypothetical protein, partial [Mycobacterium sp.]|uniref:hypothetical protein n=1 Tax=Mycobacterium sp. TaxID=1785 RepID=UPI0031E2B986